MAVKGKISRRAVVSAAITLCFASTNRFVHAYVRLEPACHSYHDKADHPKSPGFVTAASQ